MWHMQITPASLTRRRFIRSSAITATALSYSRAAARAAGAEPSDTLRVALVGWGVISNHALAPSLMRIPGVQVAAVCDILKSRSHSAQRQLDPRGQSGLQTFTNYDEMLAKAGNAIDAVIIATPCWMHAPQTRKALEAGKHVYCEKMLSNSLEPARDMVRAQRQTGKLLQIGHQRRSNPNYLHLRDKIIRERKLPGRITHLYGQWHRGVRMPLAPRLSVPDMSAIQAVGYPNVMEYANWRWFKKYGGGPLSDLGGHQIDVFNMMLGVPPRSVIASGGTDYYVNQTAADGTKFTWEHADNAMVVYEYDVPGHGLVRAHYQVLSTSGYEGYHEKLYGVEGAALISERGNWDGFSCEIWRERDTTEDKLDHWEQAKRDGVLADSTRPALPHSDIPRPAYDFPPLSKELGDKLPHQHHLENFFDTIRRDGKQSDLACPVEEAFKTCVAVLAVNEALREQRRIELKPADYTVS